MKHTGKLLLVFMLSLTVASCFKPKEPVASICPEGPSTIRTTDTLILESCSKNAEKTRWDFPNGSFSLEKKVAFFTTTPGQYKVVLTVSNNDYANDYVTEHNITVVTP